MSVKIRNRSRHLVTVELNTRDTIHLAPNEVSRVLEDYETSGNPQLKKLADGNYIDRLDEEPGSPGAGPAKKKPRRGGK